MNPPVIPEKEKKCCKCNCPIHVWHNCCNWYCCPDSRKEASHFPQQEIGKQGTRTYEETVETIKDMEETEEWEKMLDDAWMHHLQDDLGLNGSHPCLPFDIFMKLVIRDLLQQQEKRLRREFSDNHE